MTIDSDIKMPAMPADGGSARAVVTAIQDAFRSADYVRHRRGKAAVFRSFERLNTLYRFERHVTDQLIAEGDWAAGFADVTMTQRDSGRIIRCRVASFHRVRGGRLVEYRGFCDTFDAVEQTLGRELSV